MLDESDEADDGDIDPDDGETPWRRPPLEETPLEETPLEERDNRLRALICLFYFQIKFPRVMIIGM